MIKNTIIFFAISLVFALICGPVFIPILRKLKAGQTVRDNGPQTHLKKNGTPTIGGVIFLIPMTVLSLTAYFTGTAGKDIISLIIATFLYGLIGFADDFIKVVKKNKDGLLWWQKMIALVIVSVAFSLYEQFAGSGSAISFPFFGIHLSFDMSFMFVPFCTFMMVAETNAVNITDGLDGLCAGSMAIVMAFFTLYSIKCGKMTPAIFAAVTAGSLLGFLFFNVHPAKVFMGDTGSLALGAALGVVAINLHTPFILLLAGLLYVIEILSVLLQVTYFKITHGKRLFRMAPFHHHLELGGWKETKVVFVFWTFTLACCVASYFCLTL